LTLQTQRSVAQTKLNMTPESCHFIAAASSQPTFLSALMTDADTVASGGFEMRDLIHVGFLPTRPSYTVPGAAGGTAAAEGGTTSLDAIVTTPFTVLDWAVRYSPSTSHDDNVREPTRGQR
jgi:hypothetical protein